MDAPEEIIGDGNILGKSHKFFSFFAGVSPEHKLAHLVMDTIGRRFYTIKFKDMVTVKMLADKIGSTTGNVAWTNDSKAVLYSRQDQNTLRSDQIYKHLLGTDPAKDQLLYEEKDQTLSCNVFKTRSKKYFIISSGRIDEMKEGLASIRLIKWSDRSESNIDFGEAAYVAGIGDNPDVNSGVLRYNYQSMTTPPSVYDFTMDTHVKKLMKQREVLGGFDAQNYQTERVTVTARDGAKIPLSKQICLPG